MNADGSSVEEGGGEDKQCGARGHGEVPAAAGQDPASVQHQVPGHRRHHHPCGKGGYRKTFRHYIQALLNLCVNSALSQ